MAARLLAALLASAAGVSMTTIATATMQDPAKPLRFSHAQHVSDVWLRAGAEEVWRDCRGCHRFSAQNEVSAPQSECDSCHTGQGLLQRKFAAGWEQDLSLYRTRTRDAFRHHTHYMLECRECHLPPRANNLTDFDVVTGPGQCARCHEQRAGEAAIEMVKGLTWFRAVTVENVPPGLELAKFTPPDADGLAAYAAKLATVFAGPDGGVNRTPLPRGGDFDHDDHLGIGCVACHAAIPTASAKGVGTGQIPTDSCRECHLAAADTPATAAPAAKPQVRTLHSLGAFVHADHYRFLQPGAQRRTGVCTEQAYADLAGSQKDGCELCHIQDKAAVGLVQPDFPFQSGNSKHTYLDCVGCHAVDGWRTGESAAKPLHDSSDGKENDGKNGWGACAACHVPGQGAMAKVRPMVGVERRTESTFRFTTHTHPYITTAESARAQLGDCAKCHRARVPELPTRLHERVFRHATHLPARPEAKDCAGCHPSALSAATPAALAPDFRTYSTKDCTTCHIGGDVTEVIAGDAAPASRMVVQFPHGPHADAAACTDCHELDAGGADVTTKLAAKQCNQCHDHRPDEPGKPPGPKAEGLFGGEARSCVRCHHDPAPPGGELIEAVPPPRSPDGAVDPRHRIETAVFAGFEQSQFHPLGGECKTCHKADLAPDPRFPGIKRKREDHLYAVRTGSVHTGGTFEPAQCLRCHWKPKDGYSDALAGTKDTPELLQLRAKPSSKETRARFGNVNKNYPGKQADG